MDAKVTATDRLDHLDAERFRDMLASPPFAVYQRRVAAELDRARNDCERKDEVTLIHRAQGAAAAFRICQALPELILREIEKPK